MAEQLFRVRRSRGLNSAIKGETLDKFMRDALKAEMVPFAKKEYGKYVKKWKEKPKFDIPTPRVGRTGQFFSVRVDDSTMAGQRWIMIDTKGRKRGTKVIESKKFKTTRRKAVKVSTTRRGKTKLTETTIVKGGTYQRQVPFPLRLKRSGKTVNRGVLDLGTGEYDEPPALFRTKFRPGAVEPVYITRDHIAPVLRKEMTRVVENAYRRAFLKIKGRRI